jgi:heat shock protein beta
LIATTCLTGYVHSDEDVEDVTITDDTAAESEEAYSPPENSESFGFEAEVSKMLDIVVNSLYQNKDVFLRELISNASDALDKIRYLSLSNSKILDDKEELEMRIQYDEEEGTLSITDSGVGMNKADLITNLGTVARSGTTKFIEAMKETKDISMIGQFGVGFYSSFLVSDRVRVASKHPDDPVQHVWESLNGDSTFHVFDDPRGNTLGRGTEITLYLKDNASDYLKSDYLKDLVTHYSEFVTHPIFLRTTEKKMVPVEYEEDETEIEDADFDEEEETKEGDDLDIEEDSDEEEEEEEEKEPEMEEVTTQSWDQVNTNPPIWTRSEEDIDDEEYHSFYKVVSGDKNNATTWTHFDAEGKINFKALLYMPSELPDHLVNNYAPPEDQKSGLNLYVRRVLISDTFELMPQWLSFVKGVVDSDDLPLNVNRETVQETKIIKIISKKLVRKVLEMLRKFADEYKEEQEELELDENGNAYETDDGDDLDVEDTKKEDRYIGWYKKFNPSLKMGIINDSANRDRILKLLRFKTSKYHAGDDFVRLTEYIERMPEWQKDIFYFPGEKALDMDNSHFMDKFKSKDIEVLYLTDPVDEYMINFVPEYEGKKFVAITKDGIKFGDEDEDLEKRREKYYKKELEPLTKYLKKAYGSAVMRVVISNRLEKAPAMVSASQYGSSANMERLLKAQAYQHGGTDDVDMRSKASRIFEINPRHPAIIELLELVPPLDDDEEDPFQVLDSTRDAIWLLHDVALLNSGFSITNTKSFSKRMTRILKGQLNLESMALVDEVDPPEEEEEAEDFDEESMDGMNMEDLDMETETGKIEDLSDEEKAEFGI